MVRRTYTPEQAVNKLREAKELLIHRGKDIDYLGVAERVRNE